MERHRILVWFVSLALLLFGALKPLWASSLEAERMQALGFVEDVLFKFQYGPDRDQVVRWMKPVEISVGGASPEEMSALAEAIRTINPLLDGSGIELKLASGEPQNVHIIFAPRLEFYDLAEIFNFTYEAGANIVSPYRINENGEVIFGVILIAKEIEINSKKISVLIGLSQILGLLVSSPRFPKSVFYMERGFVNLNSEFLTIDKKVMRFLYTRLKPGDREEDVRRAFDKYWDTIEVD